MESEKLTVQERKNLDRQWKNHIKHMILLYQPKAGEWTPEKLEGKTLKQLEAICEKLDIR